MPGYHHASSALTLLLLLTGASLLHPSTPTPLNTPEKAENLHTDSPPAPTAAGNEDRGDEERRSVQKEETEEEEEELFKDVDPKTLAAVLLEALNRSDVGRRREEEEMNAEMEEENREVRTMKGADRDRDGRQELETLMAAHGKEREKEEEEERRKAQEEEEKMTEKVTSRTTSQTVQVQAEPQPQSPEGVGERGKDGGDTSPEPDANEEEEEEQLSPEELKSLETMMKEFPRLNTATKREGEQNQRESRGWSSYNEVLPVKGSDIAMTKKKLKWQEETQKGVNIPMFREGNFMDDFEESNRAGSNDIQSQLPLEQEVTEEEEEPEEEEEEEEEQLSPEEEEVRAKAEQEEMRRQAAEAQRAKMEEEKLADIASDMLLRYMVKQNNGNRKYSSSLSNAAEDKRSDEEQEAAEEEDLDPQTIDKLIEISSKLHLPADDVVDIISDVEKKKKKDVPPEMTSRWQRPLTPLSSSFSSTKGLSSSPPNTNSYPVTKQPSPAVNLLKTWFQEKTPTKSQDLWSKPLQTNQNLWSKPQKPIKQEVWFKSPKPLRTGYPFYPYRYPSYYQRKPYPDYYPVYFPPPPRPKPRYFLPKPVEGAYAFPPKRRYHSWIQPRLRVPPADLQQKPYYPSYPLPLYPRTFQPVRVPVMPPQQRQFYFSAPAASATRSDNRYEARKQPESRDDLEKYIQQILLKRPQISD
ncbi:neurosecretory protein VGF-like [Xyrichtys novacula]|uniref:Neurosecretory protein VGF-like n=1 Tax=Xyrichtys novacula TaxID=13765 RepID=A0AAV1HKL0_XYRNO|nr:neurosecretory protein VGF-like [Xyrichtys novacula]